MANARVPAAHCTVALSCMRIQFVDYTQTMQRGITFGWMIFSMIAMSFWTSSLTAQLVRGGSFTPAVTWDQLKETTTNETFCVEAGAANEGYFRSLEPKDHGFEIVPMDTVPGLIKATMDGSCTASDVDQEAYNAYASNKNSRHQCKSVTAAQPIARRARGMMSRTDASCVITGINALIHAYAVRDCNRTTEREGPRCNLFKLWAYHFPSPICRAPAKEGDESAVSLDWEVFKSPLDYLLILTAVGAVFTAIGRGRMTFAVPKCGTAEDLCCHCMDCRTTLCERFNPSSDVVSKLKLKQQTRGSKSGTLKDLWSHCMDCRTTLFERVFHGRRVDRRAPDVEQTRGCHKHCGRTVAFGCDSIHECCLVKMFIHSEEGRVAKRKFEWKTETEGKDKKGKDKEGEYAEYRQAQYADKNHYEEYNVDPRDCEPKSLSQEQKSEDPCCPYFVTNYQEQLWFGECFETKRQDTKPEHSLVVAAPSSALTNPAVRADHHPQHRANHQLSLRPPSWFGRNLVPV